MNHKLLCKGPGIILIACAIVAANAAMLPLIVTARCYEPAVAVEQVQATPKGEQQGTPKYQSIVLRGNVVELAPHLRDRHGAAVDDDAGKDVLLLVTESGEAHPIIKDVRSRGFWLDKRLRDRSVELHVHKFPGLPFLRLMDVYSFKDGKKYRVDYWCTICAITTYQPGPCPCCQDEIELREVEVSAD
jgi:hypothetical protein